jgi:hypothetical protein
MLSPVKRLGLLYGRVLVLGACVDTYLLKNIKSTIVGAEVGKETLQLTKLVRKLLLGLAVPVLFSFLMVFFVRDNLCGGRFAFQRADCHPDEPPAI